jgi:nucleoside-diphosphate-sugar epimerase
VDECYAKAQPLPEPWVDESLDRIGDLFGTAPHVGTGRRPRVLVTGAGGFLGCRTVELLGLGGTHEVRALVRSPRSAARLARLPVEIVLGDVGSALDMRRAMQDCDAVVHCAVGTGWPPRTAFDVTVGGTRVAATAALEAGVRRFVHISSMAVHGDRVPPRLDEASPLDPGEGFGYSRAKFLAEQAVSELAGQGLPAITLRPTRIYGPFSRTFTIRPLLALKRDALWLAGDADSPANMVYVDNVVSAILRALAAPAAEHGQAFFVSDEEQLSWRAFYGFFAEAAWATVHVSPAAETRGAGRPGWIRSWAGAVRQIGTSPELRALVKKIMWTDPIGRVPRALWDRTPWLQERALRAAGVDQAVVYRETPPEPPERVVFTIEPTTIDITKARTRLGYRPLVRSDRAMQLTREWARHARLLPEDAPVPVETATP